jgi:ABC-type uncharacterized transport system substrate-binding protein
MIGASTLLIGWLTACATSSAATNVDSIDTSGAELSGKKIVWVDSYHEGYEWSDGLENGIKNTLAGTGIELKIIRMDTKRNVDENFGKEAGTNAEAEIRSYNPDVVIATDDNAQKFLVVPYLKGTETPVVFAGVNWDASVYGYPSSNITGMVEVELPIQLVTHLKQYAQGEKVGFLTVNNETQRKIVQIYNDRFFNGQMQIVWANSWDEFKAGFLKLQDETDMVIVSNNAGINDWDEAKAIAFFTENTKVPTGSVYSWMAPYTLLVLGIVPEEQGQWTVETSLKVLSGTPVSQVSVEENKKGELILNLDMAEKLDIIFPPSVLQNAQIYSPEG